jgi:hypothetical protein
MNPLDYLKFLAAGVTKQVPAPIQRFAGQVWNKTPVAVNPFRTRKPTTTLGSIGKSINPLNPANALFAVLPEVVRGITKDDELADRTGYFSLGPQIGLALNILDAGSAGAPSEIKEEQRLKEALANFQRRQQIPQKTPAPASGPRVDASTTQMIDIGAPAPRQAPRLVPVTPAAPPNPVISQAAYTAAQTGFRAPTDIPLSEFYAAQKGMGAYAEQGGELQRRLKELGGAAGMSDEALMQWAQQNPDLALRELMKRERRGITPTAD